MFRSVVVSWLGVLVLCLLAALPVRASEVELYNKVNDAVRAQSAGDYFTAFQLYTQLIDSGKLADDPKILAYLHNNRAVIWLQRDNETMAFADFQKAMELAPDPTTYYNRALIYADRGRKAEALADLEQAIRLFPRYAKAFELRGHLMLETGNTAQGRKDLAKARELKMKIAFLGPGEYTAKGHAQEDTAPEPMPQFGRESRRVE